VSPVSVLGGGSWGTALAQVIAGHGAPTKLWMRSEEGVREVNQARTNRRYLPNQEVHPLVTATTDLAEAARAELILLALPSSSLREVARALGDHVRGDQILLSATKGLEVETLTRMSEILLQETCARKIGALSGPNLAAEVMAGMPSATVVASRFDEVITGAERVLAGPRLRVYGNFDLVGVELAGALKNIIAIAAGVAAGLGFGANTLSLLLTRGLAEIWRFAAALGAEQSTFLGLAGVGDLVATCASPLSRNHTVGRRLAKGERLDAIQADMRMVAEGVNTTRAVCRHADRLGVEMPIARAMHQVLFEGGDIQRGLEALMTRASRYEADYLPIGLQLAVAEP
jgi:glycerol-3-phosphate dehydrogenase (NAD(P)+)